jgi:large subunit ribosomal protein L5
MKILEYYYKKIIRYDLVNKFFYHDLKELPKLQKIILNFGCKSVELKTLSTALLSLELITRKKGILTTSKRPNTLIKIRKGHPVGCKIILEKAVMYQFFFTLLAEVFPRLKDFKGIALTKKNNSNNYSCIIKEMITFKELSNHFYLFNNLPPLNITVVTNTKTQKELLFFLNSFKLPVE